MRPFSPLEIIRHGAANGVWKFNALLLVALFCTTPIVSAQTALKNVEVVQPYDGSGVKVDFSLPLPDRVSSLDIQANGTPVEKSKVIFTPVDKLANYHCAVLLLVDKTLGNGKDTNDKAREKLWKAVRDTMGKFSAVANTAPYQIAVATISSGNLEILAPMGSKKNIVDSAIEKLTYTGVSPELYLGTKRAIEWFGGTPGERKYVVLISDGISNDKVISQQDVVQAAMKARVRLCTIGFPKSVEARDIVQRLGPLADETGGYSLRADGSDPKLPPDAENNLLKFIISGGQAEIRLETMKNPIALDGKIQTEFGKIYTFRRSIEAAEGAGPSHSASTASPVSGSISLAEKFRSHLLLATVGSAAVLVALALLAILLMRTLKAPPVAPPPETPLTEPLISETFTPKPPSMPLEDEDTQIPQPAPAFAWLVTLDADETRYPITKAAVRIGRKADNDIVMKNNSVSNHHAELVKRGDKFIIADLDAANGVYLRGKRVEKSPLVDGDIIELGEVRLRFTLNPPEN